MRPCVIINALIMNALFYFIFCNAFHFICRGVLSPARVWLAGIPDETTSRQRDSQCRQRAGNTAHSCHLSGGTVATQTTRNSGSHEL